MASTRDLPIGVFDSGVGGLTVVRQIRRVLPHEDILYLGDTARVPYGTKSPTTVVRFACENTQFLVDQGVKALVVACNTASAWALPTLERRFELPIFGVIAPGAEVALRRTRTRRIGVIGTAATVRSMAYSRAIRARDEEVRVFARACPLLVPLVEEGWLRHPVTERVVRLYLAPLKRQRIDTLVLGCTHYPLLKPVMRRLLGPGVALVDSATSCAQQLEQQLERRGLLRTARPGPGVIQPFVTDEVERFAQIGRRFLAAPMEPVWRIDLRAFAET